MEKLQSAIEKARQKREGVAQSSPVAPKEKQPRAAPGTLDSIPLVDLDTKVLNKNKVFAYKRGPETNAFDVLRTKTILRMREHNWTRIGITSPLPNCGKTAVAANLIAAMTRQEDLRSILIDFDLSNPSLHKTLGIESKASVSDFLTEDAPFEDAARRISKNAAIAFQKAPHPDPTKLLLKDQVEHVLDRVQQTYQPDLMIFDLPPMLVNDNTRAVLHNIDCVMIIIAADKTTVSQIDTTERDVAQYTNVLGIVLNEVRYIGEDNMQQDGY